MIVHYVLLYASTEPWRRHPHFSLPKVFRGERGPQLADIMKDRCVFGTLRSETPNRSSQEDIPIFVESFCEDTVAHSAHMAVLL